MREGYCCAKRVSSLGKGSNAAQRAFPPSPVSLLDTPFGSLFMLVLHISARNTGLGVPVSRLEEARTVRNREN